MANISLSDAESTFILHGVESNHRTDGRSISDYRDIELETGVVNNASGSARLRLANTDILVGVKTEIDKPSPFSPSFGKLQFFVDCSANATPEFEGRGGEQLALELAEWLTAAYESPGAFDFEALCILPGQQCWKLYVDILILECGGNLFDAVSLAAKSALFDTKLPRVTAQLMDAGESELILSDDPFDCTRIPIEQVPILVTVCKIGDYCVVDPTAEEEQCSKASVVVSACKRKEKYLMSSMHTVGDGALHTDTLLNCLDLGLSLAEVLDNALMDALKEEESRKLNKRHEIVGFLK